MKKKQQKPTLNQPCAQLNPKIELHGQDIDGRCCRMAVLNLALRSLTGFVTEGDALRLESRRRWRICGGLIAELPIGAEPALVIPEPAVLAAPIAAGRLF